MTDNQKITQDLKVSVSLYIHGKDLDPDEISVLLAATPTTARKRGETRISKSSQEITNKKGLWALESDLSDGEIGKIFDRILGAISPTAGDIYLLKGVEEAYVDVFAIVPNQNSSVLNQEIFIDSQAIRKIQEIGIPLKITIAVRNALDSSAINSL